MAGMQKSEITQRIGMPLVEKVMEESGVRDMVMIEFRSNHQLSNPGETFDFMRGWERGDVLVVVTGVESIGSLEPDDVYVFRVDAGVDESPVLNHLGYTYVSGDLVLSGNGGGDRIRQSHLPAQVTSSSLCGHFRPFLDTRLRTCAQSRQPILSVFHYRPDNPLE